MSNSDSQSDPKLEAGIPDDDKITHQQTNQSEHIDYAHYGPLAHVNTAGTLYPPFAGQFQPGAFRPGPVEQRKIANPAPLGLCGFALTTFVSGCINMKARGITEPYMWVGPAYAYGGFVQILAGMWEMAVGNTFGATAFASYGGFWISMAITFTSGGFHITEELVQADNGSMGMFYDSFGLFLFGWFIFSFVLLICTMKSTVVFFSLFFCVDLAFLLLGIGYMVRDEKGAPNAKLLMAGGFFDILAAFLAWWAAFAGIADTSNSFFIVPVWHFPWSDKGKASRRKTE